MKTRNGGDVTLMVALFVITRRGDECLAWVRQQLRNPDGRR